MEAALLGVDLNDVIHHLLDKHKHVLNPNRFPTMV